MTLLTVQEVAERLCFTPQTVRNMVKRGELIGIYRPGAFYRIPEQSLIDFMEQHTCRPQESLDDRGSQPELSNEQTDDGTSRTALNSVRLGQLTKEKQNVS